MKKPHYYNIKAPTGEEKSKRQPYNSNKPENGNKSSAKQTTGCERKWKMKQMCHNRRQATRQADHGESERTGCPTKEKPKRRRIIKTHIHAIWLWKNEYSCGAKSLRIVQNLTAIILPPYTQFLSTKHNLLNIKILPERKRRRAFSVTWKRLFHRAGKPIWARGKAHMGRRERLYGYAIILQEEADQGNMAPKNRRDREIWRSDTEENTKHKACRRKESGQDRESARPHSIYFAKKECQYFLLTILHKYSVRWIAAAACWRQYEIRMEI